MRIDPAADSVQARLAVRGLSVFLGGSGVGVSLSDGVVGLVISAHGTAVEYAVDATGMVALTGVPGVTASGLIRLRRSTFAAAVSETIDLGDGSGQVDVVFDAGAADVLSGTGLTIAALGQSLTADVSFAVSAATTTVTVSNLSFAVGSTLTFANTGSAGTLTVSATSVTGSLSGTLTATLPGVALTGSFALDLLTDADPSAAQHVWLTATNASLTIAGQQIAADALTVQRVTVAGVSTTTIAIDNGRFQIQSGSTVLLSATAITGSFDVTATGVRGSVSATITSNVAGLGFATSVTVEVDSSAPFLRVQALGTTVTVAGQAITADLTITRGVDTAGATRLAVGIANGSIDLGPVHVGSVQGALVVTAAGLAVSVRGTVTIAVTGVSFTGTLDVLANSTGVAVDTSIRVGDADVALVLPGGAAYLRVAGTDIHLDVFGQTLSGDLVVEQTSTTTTTVTVSSASLQPALSSPSSARNRSTAGASAASTRP